VIDVVVRPVAAATASAVVGASVTLVAPDGSRLPGAAPRPVNVTVTPAVPPGLMLVADASTAGVGQAVPFHATLSLPPGISASVMLRDTLPAGLDYVLGSAQVLSDGGTFTAAGGALALQAGQSGRTLTLDLGAVAASGGAARDIVLGFTLRVSGPAGTALVNSAVAGTGYADSAVASASVSVVNTAPTLAGIAAVLAGRDDTVSAPFTGLVVTDPDAGQAESLRITIDGPGHGTVIVGGAGTYDATTGVFTVGGTAPQVAAAAAALRFVPTRQLVALGQSVTTRFDVTVRDATGAAATAAVALTVAAANAAPLLRNAAPCHVAAPGSPVALFTGLQLSDADAAQTETLTIRLSDPALGRFSGPGTYDAARGTMTLTGRLNVIQDDATRVLFIAASSVPGHVGTIELTIDDGAGGVARDTAPLAISSAAPGSIPAFIGPAGTTILVDPAGPALVAGHAGQDAFYVDASAGPQAVALGGFGGGDAAILWGYDPARPFRWSDADAPPDVTGRTLQVAGPGAGMTVVTFAGLGVADTDRFAIASARFDGLDYLLVQSPA